MTVKLKVVAYAAPMCPRCGMPGVPWALAEDHETRGDRIALKCVDDGVVWDTTFKAVEL